MLTILSLLLHGWSLCLALPAAATPETAPPPVRPADQIKKTTLLEVKGILRRVADHWEITAGGKTYRPDFSASKELAAAAEKLNGKSVFLTGKLEQGVEFRTITSQDGLALMSVPVYFDAIIASRLEAIETDAVRETISVEVTGTLEFWPATRPELMASKVAGRDWVGYVVTVNGKPYLLETNSLGKLAERAKSLKGHRVTVTGRLESWSDNGGCVRGPRSYPLVIVSGLRPVSSS